MTTQSPDPTRPAPLLTVPDQLAEDLGIVTRIDAVPTILSICARTTGMGVSCVARVTRDRWVAAAALDTIGFGIAAGAELPIETTFCQTVRDSGKPVIIDHAAQDEVWSGHPIPTMYGIESYLAVAINLPDGTFWGTLCGIDPRPNIVSQAETVGTFQLFADLIGHHIDTLMRKAQAEEALRREQEEGRLRERFVAVLGHDLRNPIAVTEAGARLIAADPGLSERSRGVLDLMGATSRRMSGLVDDVLDFARGRFGVGIPVRASGAVELGPTIAQILDEQRSLWPERIIEARIGPLLPVRCDTRRIGQLLGNLLANALTHGAPDEPVTVEARTEGGTFHLSVGNGGAPIPQAVLDDLFEPFVRGGTGGDGLGLGLYIAAQIAQAHGGTLDASSDGSGTRMTLTMPGGD